MTPFRPILPLTVLGLAVVAVSVTACGGDDDTTPSAADLDGRTFVATAIEGYTIVDGSEVVVSFADDLVLVEAGCNSQRAGYDVEDGSLVVGELAATMMACDDVLMAQDQLVGDIMRAGPAITLDGDEMVLTTDSATVTLSERT